MDQDQVPYWLAQYSQEEEWQRGLAPAAIEKVIAYVSDEQVSDLMDELHKNKLTADRQGLKNLLRHWARIALDERAVSLDVGQVKRARDAAKKLGPLLDKIEQLLASDAAGMRYYLSQYLDHPLRVHRTYDQLAAMQEAITELRPAVEGLSGQKLSRGAKADETTLAEVRDLVEIFEYVTNTSARRVYDQKDSTETGLFYAFADRAMRMIDGEKERSIDWLVRMAVEDRRAQGTPGAFREP